MTIDCRHGAHPVKHHLGFRTQTQPEKTDAEKYLTFPERPFQFFPYYLTITVTGLLS